MKFNWKQAAYGLAIYVAVATILNKLIRRFVEKNESVLVEWDEMRKQLDYDQAMEAFKVETWPNGLPYMEDVEDLVQPTPAKDSWWPFGEDSR
jgi:hypothetical protein